MFFSQCTDIDVFIEKLSQFICAESAFRELGGKNLFLLLLKSGVRIEMKQRGEVESKLEFPFVEGVYIYCAGQPGLQRTGTRITTNSL
jgi:hypothetical protein